jgi:solute carrier family 25 phosphate transporter 23/24/25/41
MWATMIGMYKNEGGFPALYRGIVPTVAGVAPYVSTLGALYYVWLLTRPGWLKLHDL